jgi:hypothetical protein
VEILSECEIVGRTTETYPTIPRKAGSKTYGRCTLTIGTRFASNESRIKAIQLIPIAGSSMTTDPFHWRADRRNAGHTRLNIGEFNFKLVGFPEKREKTIRAISAKTRELSSESCYVELSIEVSAVSEIEVNQPLVEIVYDIKSAARSVGCVFEEFP